jgi:O-antigen ligase
MTFSTGQYTWLALPFGFLFFYAGWKHKHIFFLLLLFFLPFSFEYHFTGDTATDIPDELLMLYVSCLFLGYWVWSPELIARRTWQHPLLILLYVWFAWMIIAVIFSTNLLVSVKFLLAKTWYSGAFVLAPIILLREKENFRRSAIVLSVAMILVVMIVLTRQSFQGLSFASVNEALFPFFRNHVNYSAMLVCIIPVLTALFSFARLRAQRYALGFAIVLAVTGLFFSYSRGAWLALPIGFFAGWLIKKRALLITYIMVWVVAVGLLFWLKNQDRYLKYSHDYRTTIYHTDFGEHIIATYKLKDVSTAERFYRWIAGVRMIKEKALTGYGPNTFYENYKPFTIPAFRTWVSDNKEHSTVHNYFLLLAIEQGIPGLVFFIILLGAMLWYAQHLYHRVPDRFYKTVARTTGIILVMIMVVNFLSDLIETDKIGSLFFLCLSILVVVDINTREKKKSDENFRSRPADF